MEFEEHQSFGDLLLALAHAGIVLRASNDRVSCEIPKSALVNAAWLGKVARDLTSNGNHNFNGLVADEFLYPLATNSNPVATVICLHPITGGLWEYQKFLAKAPPEFSVYGIHAGAWFCRRAVPISIREMAREYSKRIIKTGLIRKPIILYGFSSGGLIALEVARHLQARGVSVALLVFGDTRLTAQRQPFMGLQGFSNDLFIWWLFLHHCIPPTQIASSNRLKGNFSMLTEIERISSIMSLMGSNAEMAIPFSPTVMEGCRRFGKFRSSLEAYFQYEPKQYAGRVAYVNSTATNPSSSVGLREALIGPMRQIVVRGSHMHVVSETASVQVWSLIGSELADSISIDSTSRPGVRHRFSLGKWFNR